MVYVAATALFVLAGLNYRIGRTLLYPPMQFSLVWGLLLSGIVLSGDTFYPVTTPTLTVYVLGAFAFSLGGLLVLAIFPRHLHPVPRRGHPMSARARKILIVGLVVLIICLPLYWGYTKSLTTGSGLAGFWRGVRVSSIRISDPRVPHEFHLTRVLFMNVVTLAIVLALITYYEHGRTPSQKLIRTLYLILGLIYSLMTAAVAGAAILLLGMLGIHALRAGRFRVKLVVLYLVLFLAAFSAVSFVLEKGNVRTSHPISYNIPELARLLRLYALGGVVAFDQVVENPHSVRANWSPFRFLALTANKFGASYKVPSLHADFTMVSPSLRTNVYTIYFGYYPNFGLFGTVVVMWLLGGALTWVYLSALAGIPWAAILYGILTAGVVLSGFAEEFFLQLNLILKATVLSLVIYNFPALSGRAGQESDDSFVSQDSRVYRWSS